MHAETSAPIATGEVVVVTEPLGGSPLSRAIQEGRAPARWHVAAPASVDGWRARVADTRAAFAGADWLASVSDAISATGPGRQRLERVARGQGVLVTTGQQPGLFGGPIYTWSKALSALALADAIERALGVPAAPLFWAATDDADLLEAQRVWVATRAGAVELRGGATAPAGTPAARVPQGDLSEQLAVLRDAAGSAAHSQILKAVEQAHSDPSRTIGAAYLDVLEATLGPLGIPILDAAHPSVRAAGRTLLQASLQRHEQVAAGLRAREEEIRGAGFEPQVEAVAGLTPVFVHDATGAKRRITAAEASSLTGDPDLGANVLLRPVMEATILPTLAYVAGPGELAYFAQVTALAEAIGARIPVAVPRWSGTLVEPRMQRLADRLGVTRDDLVDPHVAESRLARAAMPEALRAPIVALQPTVDAAIQRIASADASGVVPYPVVEGLRRRIAHQVERFERRAIAAVKRREDALMRDIAHLRGFFFPGGKRQERALSIVPTLARHGAATLEVMRREADRHAARVLGLSGASRDGGEAT